MTFQELAVSRITPKFANANNFKNILRFTTSIFDKTVTDVELIKDLKNLNSESTIVLNEIGKLLGFFPRPSLKVGLIGSGFFQYGVTEYGLFPYAQSDENLEIRELTNLEYSRLLNAAAVLTTFNGVMDDWVLLYTRISGATSYIVNKASSYDVVIQKDLSDFDKALVEFLTNDIDNLTVKKNFLGTSDGTQVFQYGVTQYGVAPYIKKW